MFQEEVKTIGGLRLHVIPTKKYKTNTLVLKMKAPLCERDVTMRALVPYVLQNATERHPSMKALRTYLDELYGATLQVDLAKKGENHIITIRMDIANEKFLGDTSPLLREALTLFSDMLFRPFTEGDGFSVAIVEQEKRALKQKIQSLFDDKMRYAQHRLMEEMYKGSPYALDVHGKLEDVDSIDAKRLYEHYEHMLKHDEIDLYIVGDVMLADVEHDVAERFSLEVRPPRSIATPTIIRRTDVQEVVEKQDVKQGKLHLGYRTNTTYNDPDYDALQVWNGIFGGFAHSKLFINVREKASLAYYAASRIESHQGMMMVMAGIDPSKYERALEIIHAQAEAMRNGQFSDEEIVQTKAVIRNQLLETIDTARGMIEMSYHNVIATNQRPLQQWLEGIEKVTREDIVRVGEKIELDTIYFLTEKEGEKK
ncbi:zinc protease [Anoxybacillus gonensis]|uniref:Insulinase family protein n=1 Tax=Anoxybacillus gonensis TaxID=198467 RepID=A0AAW7TM51_9BACL|nr:MULTISPECIES: pitrilysin family protein [Anoxybacillus]AKS38243.1 zinc protease [Anoxybacillus gonensis]KGP61287.1 zinc protease [Anoxybacillus gonensis]MBW9218411.1 insulinase family protein [Anoxybacillus sp. ST70]MCQ5365852.1 insulinase family protein [Anoxybacillus gonensis]MDO0878761.1 insulinase family protein [Anoxybacillus gonensis]